MVVLVKNRNHTTDYDSDCCGTWIAHWKKHKRMIPTVCRGCGGTGMELVGGHVNKVGNYTDDRWYIVPLCKSCNGTPNKKFYVDSSDLVWVRACE